MKKPTLEEAKQMLANSTKPGFRKANKKALQEAETIVREDFKNRGEAFMEDYRELCKKHGMEIQAEMQPVEGMPKNIAKAGLMLNEYVEQKQPQMKPWSEAMAENLDLRASTKHILNAEGDKCEVSGLPVFVEIDGKSVRAWGENDYGVSEEYRTYMIDKIEEQKKKEAEEAKEEKDAE